MYQNIYVGPYAQWLVKKAVDDDALADLDATNGPLWSNALSNGAPPVRVKQGRALCYCFMPGDEERPGKPNRSMLLSVDLGPVEDWSATDSKAEMDWYTRTFREELGALEQFFGAPPTIHWGLVTWVS